MPVLINGYRLVPAPLVTFEERIDKKANGEKLGAEYSINFAGNLLPKIGNPVSATGNSFSSAFETAAGWMATYDSSDDQQVALDETDLLVSTITKQEQIRNIFGSGSIVQVEIVGFNHDQGVKFMGVVDNVSFPSDGRWALPSQYNVSLVTSNFLSSANSGLFPNNGNEHNFSFYVKSCNDDWNIEETDMYIIATGNITSANKVYSVTHGVSAEGRLVYDSTGGYLNGLSPWQQASGYVHGVVGVGFNNVPTGILVGLGSNYAAVERKIVEKVNRTAGSYEISEVFTFVNTGITPVAPYAIEDFNISIDQTEGALTNVSIQGSIKGLNTNNPTSSTTSNKYQNALNYYNAVESSLYSKAKNNCGLDWLHPMPKTKTVGRLPFAGEVSYSYSYDNRPPNIIPGSISEEIIVNDTYPGQIFAVIPVIGRDQPVLQYLNSRTEYKRNLQINVNMRNISNNWGSNTNSSGVWTNATYTGVYNWLFTQKPSVTNQAAFEVIYDACNPANEVGVISSKVFYTAPQETWNPKTGQYSYVIEWTYAK